MPMLEILDSYGKLEEHAWHRILAAMSLPNEPYAHAAQEGALSSEIERYVLKNKIKYIPYSIITDQTELVLRNATGGATAGQLLLTLARLKAHAPKYFSMKKAQRLVQLSNVEKPRKKMGGKIAPTPDSEIKNYWERFRGVSHLWAGYQIFCQDRETPPDMTDVEIRRFLAIASSLLKFVLEHRVVPTKGIWMIPESIKLKDVPLRPQALSNSELNLLSKRRGKS